MSSKKTNKILILPNELMAQMLFFMPLCGLINCSKSNWTLSTLGIPRTKKVHEKVRIKNFKQVIGNICLKIHFLKFF